MKRSPSAAMAALLFVFMLGSAALSALIPLGEAADEVSHHSYVRYLAVHGPEMPPVVPGTTVFGETFQPPLYYALTAPLTAWLPPGDPANLGFTIPVENNPDWELGNPNRARVLLQPAEARWPWQGEALGWHLARLLSILPGVVTLAATFRLGRLVFPNEPWTALLATSLTAFLPSFIGLSAVVTNDTLATALGALLLLQLARLATRDELGWPDWALAGLLGGMGVWTKASGWVFVATTIAAALFALARWRADGATARARRVATGLMTAGMTWLLLALPLFALNLTRSGDLLGRGIQAQVTEARLSLSPGEGVELLVGLYRTWWAGFGGAVHLHFPDWVHALLLLPLAVAAVGLFRRHLQRESASPPTRTLIPLLALHTTVVLVAWGVWTSSVMGTGQGRLLFPALPAISILIAGGLSGFVRGEERKAAAAQAWSLATLVLPVLALTTILLPAYRATLPPAEAPAEAARERWEIEGLPLTLEEFYLPLTIDDRLRPGSENRFYAAWRATGPLPDIRLRLRWIDAGGQSIWVKEGSPIAAHPLTDEWRPGPYAAWHRIILPLGIEPGWYRLMLSVVDAETRQPLPLIGPTGSSGTEIMVGQTTVVAP